MYDWSDPDMHFLKRHLSRFEKQSLLNTTGRAVIFPATPDTEVEELLAVGFDGTAIYAIERDPAIADALYEHYYDRINVHWDQASVFLTRARGPFAYVHLDYCGHFGDEELAGFEALRTKLTPIARVRISLYHSRRVLDQLQREEIFHENVVHGLLALIANGDDDRFQLAARELSRMLLTRKDDTTVLLTGIALLNFTFGLSALEFSDQIVSRTLHTLPPINGTHRINALRRFHYVEPSNKNVMTTLWFDVVPVPPSTVVHEESWKALEVLQTLGMCITQPVLYTNPGLFLS